ncbi:MAG: hypothetical protein KDC26_02930 [Armatimonadetes bacterium]|nr:hypothetical protein [Armatimonadota bacterium]
MRPTRPESRVVAKRSRKLLTPLPSNIQAINAVEQLLSGYQPYVLICGQSGWGKSHLLRSCAVLAEEHSQDRVLSMSAIEFLKTAIDPGLTGHLILDDIQDALRNPRTRHELMYRLERRMRLHRPTLLSSSLPATNKKLIAALPSYRRWLVVSMDRPSASERVQIVAKIAESEGIRIHPSLAELMANHMNGNGNSIVGALQRLRLMNTNWSQESSLLEACGILMPYLIGKQGWDPRDVIHDICDQTIKNQSLGLNIEDVACYLMLSRAKFSEQSVSDFVGKTVGQCYLASARIRKQIQRDETRAKVEICEQEVLKALAS